MTKRILPEWIWGRRAVTGFLTGWEDVVFELADADDEEFVALDPLAAAIRSGEALLMRERHQTRSERSSAPVNGSVADACRDLHEATADASSS